jgi:FAD/FMN-containing dehydrogenase
VRSLAPLQWRAEVEAGLPTAQLHRLARENGLYFPPDPGAAEQSQIGGNVATNAGGPHAFKYGVTGAWVTGLEVVTAQGQLLRLGSGLRKDVSAYDLKSLVVGSEGTLAVITAVHVRFIPPPEVRYPVLGFYPDANAGSEAIEACLASGIVPAALEYLDNDAMEIVRSAFPFALPNEPCFAVIAEADGSAAEAALGREALLEAMSHDSLVVGAPTSRHEIRDLWRWREGVGLAADAALGGKVSEDIVVPLERLAEAVEGTRRIAERNDLASCSWGHAGDGNLHSSFLFARNDAAGAKRARLAAGELFELAVRLGGAISGEHGVGIVKASHLGRLLHPHVLQLHHQVKQVFDPNGLLNPGKKTTE